MRPSQQIILSCFSTKAISVTKFKIAGQNFSYFFPDDPPTFAFSPLSRRRGRPPKMTIEDQVSNIIFELDLLLGLLCAEGPFLELNCLGSLD